MGPLLILLLAGWLAAVESPAYQTWSQGRPGEAAEQLLQAAQDSDDWRTWFDFGLAAAAADRQPLAVAGLVRAHQAAPLQPEPIAALRALSVPVPVTVQERLGLLALPGSGWLGVVVVFIAGLGIGLAIVLPVWRWPGFGAGVVLLALAGPGLVAPWLTTADRLLVVVEPVQLLDGTGAPIGPQLPAGSLVERLPREPWADRILVRDPQAGGQGWLAIADNEIRW